MEGKLKNYMCVGFGDLFILGRWKLENYEHSLLYKNKIKPNLLIFYEIVWI